MKQSARVSLTGACALAAASAAAHISWQDRHALPEGVAGGAIAFLSNQLLYAGGTTWREGIKHWLAAVKEYDLKRETWSDGPALPEPLAYGGFLSTDHSLEILGGMNDKGVSRKCWRLEKGATSWKASGTLPVDSVLSRAEAIGDHVYLIGGCPDAADLSRCSDAIWQRDATGKWTSLTRIPSGPIAVGASVTVGNELYLFGGCTPAGEGKISNLDGANRFNPADGQWKKLHSLPAAARALSAVRLDDHRILLAGGYVASQEEAKGRDTDFGFTEATWIYHTDTDTYESASPLPLRIAGMEFIAHGNTVFGIGGEDRMRSRSNRVLAGAFRK
jgi:N-acetylneuraminic acid mutarotase